MVLTLEKTIATLQQHRRTSDEHAIADLICDLGHSAEERELVDGI